MRLAVTTALDPDRAERDAAERVASTYGWPSAPREGRPLAEVAARCDVDSLLVLGARRVTLWADGVERLWAPGMGELRLKRLMSGERTTRDGLLDAADLQPGDAVLDATLGLGMDALVAAGAVGPGGTVVGLEASPVLAAMASEGFRRHGAEAARRIAVVATDADAFFGRTAARSFDVVLFDPMFRHAKAQGGGFDLVREFGDPGPLTAERLFQARHVARRWVVVKDGAPGPDLARLGLTPLPSARGARRLYARVAPL
ncbi:MAG TPA: class I SAM-dependent methyltransferase [Polyangia bacterium]